MLLLLLNLKSFFKFIPATFAFIIKYWKELSVLLLIVAVLYQNLSVKRWIMWVDTIPYYRQELIIKQELLDQAVAANNVLSTAIETTNKQLAEWKEVSDQLEANNAELSTELQGLRQETQVQVETVLAGPTPEGSDEAISFLRDSIPEIQFNNKVVIP